MGAEAVYQHYEYANVILEYAITAIPSILGLGALGSIAYGTISTGARWLKEGGEMLKLGASILGGAAIGGLGAARGVFMAHKAGAFESKKEATKTLGSRLAAESFKGGVSAATGSRGWLSVANRSLWGDEAFKTIISKKPDEEVIIKKGRGEEEIIQRKLGDTSGITERRKIRRVIDKPPPDGGGGGGDDNPPPPDTGVAKTHTGELVQVVRDPRTIQEIQSGKWKPEGGEEGIGDR